MSDSPEPLAAAKQDSLDRTPSPTSCQKRLHAGENGSFLEEAREAPPQQPEPGFGEPEPPQKRVKVDPDSELDIRFLICSKVSDW